MYDDLPEEPMRRLASAVAVLLTSIIPAGAEMGGIGSGTQTCSQFAKSYQLGKRLQQVENIRLNVMDEIFFSWAQGFFTGLNTVPIMTKYGRPRDLSSIPVEQQQRFLRDYCDKHPQASYMEGVTLLYNMFEFSK
jgi:hypothetical protein